MRRRFSAVLVQSVVLKYCVWLRFVIANLSFTLHDQSEHGQSVSVGAQVINCVGR